MKDPRSRKTLLDVLEDNHACGESISWAVKRTSLQDAWDKCTEPSWLAWSLCRLVGARDIRRVLTTLLLQSRLGPNHTAEDEMTILYPTLAGMLRNVADNRPFGPERIEREIARLRGINGYVTVDLYWWLLGAAERANSTRRRGIRDRWVTVDHLSWMLDRIYVQPKGRMGSRIETGDDSKIFLFRRRTRYRFCRIIRKLYPDPVLLMRQKGKL